MGFRAPAMGPASPWRLPRGLAGDLGAACPSQEPLCWAGPWRPRALARGLRWVRLLAGVPPPPISSWPAGSRRPQEQRVDCALLWACSPPSAAPDGPRGRCLCLQPSKAPPANLRGSVRHGPPAWSLGPVQAERPAFSPGPPRAAPMPGGRACQHLPLCLTSCRQPGPPRVLSVHQPHPQASGCPVLRVAFAGGQDGGGGATAPPPPGTTTPHPGPTTPSPTNI